MIHNVLKNYRPVMIQQHVDNVLEAVLVPAGEVAVFDHVNHLSKIILSDECEINFTKEALTKHQIYVTLDLNEFLHHSGISLILIFKINIRKRTLLSLYWNANK